MNSLSLNNLKTFASATEKGNVQRLNLPGTPLESVAQTQANADKSQPFTIARRHPVHMRPPAPACMTPLRICEATSDTALALCGKNTV
mmetsp:Transcript_117043/g.233229  ORF Transcript_117043/g.233229 Transcript_117043/m.233229 type:complete len:88 (-) Transcript_117043:7-270(-)